MLAVLACGCSSSGSASTPSSARRPPDAQLRVDRMVLGNASLPGYTVERAAAERLKDQLLPRGAEHAVAANRLIRASWVASAHALLASPNDVGPPIFSVANLFRTAADAERVWTLGTGREPGVTSRRLPIPPGAPPHAAYEELQKGSQLEFEIGWRQGPVIGLDIVGLAASPAPPVRVRAQIAAALGRAARAQQARITHALEVDSSI